MSRVLIIGIDSFSGAHLSTSLKIAGYDVIGTSLSGDGYRCDITDYDSVEKILLETQPEYIINLSAISFVGHGDDSEFYRVNTIGAINILKAAKNIAVKKIILVSSAIVYGNQSVSILDESLCPRPINHYGASKYAMESMASDYFNTLPIVIARAFNYTGVGQRGEFLIPKIVEHYKRADKSIELGNLDVIREFNDIGFVCEAYKRLLESDVHSKVVNIASGRGIELLDVIEMMNNIASYNIDVRVNPAFVRANEIKTLTGSNEKLFSLIGKIDQKDFKQTLLDMYNS